MFAVPDWSVSADKLKSEAPALSITAQNQQQKKQKAGGNNDKVTHQNVSDLWARVVEGKKAQKTSDPKLHGNKRKRTATADDNPIEVANANHTEKPENASTHHPDGDAPAHKKKRRRRSKPSSHRDNVDMGDRLSDAVSPGSGSTMPRQKQSQAPVTMTPLQKAMRDKLISARFRHLNEALYTKPSAEAYRMFDESPDMFAEYHEGFRRQVQVWPENPIDGYIAAIRHRSRLKAPAPSRSGAAHPASSSPLPHTNGVCTIADLGCGDARLAQTLMPNQKRLRVRILSFDLQEQNPVVTKADISALPLNDSSVDVAIFCLALMGTNWTDFIEEAYRVLRWKGELWIAEIKSRFGRVESKGKRSGGQGGEIVEHSVGKRRKAAAADRRRNKDHSLDRPEDAELDIQVDDTADSRQDTNVGAFVEALRKRGFVPHSDSESAIDTSNKMFVKMHFVKSAEPIKGKGTKTSSDSRKPKFLPHDNDDECEDSAILKPCVYKLR